MPSDAYMSETAIIGLDNGSPPVQCQSIISICC